MHPVVRSVTPAKMAEHVVQQAAALHSCFGEVVTAANECLRKAVNGAKAACSRRKKGIAAPRPETCDACVAACFKYRC